MSERGIERQDDGGSGARFEGSGRHRENGNETGHEERGVGSGEHRDDGSGQFERGVGSGAPARQAAAISEANDSGAQDRIAAGGDSLHEFLLASFDIVYRMSADWKTMRYLRFGGQAVPTPATDGSWLERYIHPQDRAELLARIDEAVRSCSPFEMEHRVRRADGTLGWIHSRAMPVVDAQRRIREWFGAANDITARKQAEQALRESELRTAAERDALSRLYELGHHCAPREAAMSGCIEAILDAAIALSRAEKGSLHIYDGERDRLMLVAQRGFSRAFREQFGELGCHGGGSGRAAFDKAERVIVEDLEQSGVFRGTPSLAVLLDSGVRSLQSTPLISGEGHLLGMISTHFGLPHRPDEHELRLLDLLARQAADFLERRRAEDVLRRQAAELRTILDILPIGVGITHDARGDQISVNASFREMLRLEEGQNASLTGPGKERVPFRCLRDGEPVPDDELPMQRAARSGQPVWQDEVDMVLEDGRSLHMMVNAAPLFDEQGEVRGAVAAHVDVTSFREAQAAAEAANRQKDEFLAMLGHELRNPLAALRNAVETAAVDSPLRNAALAIASRQTDQLGHLVDDLLDVARITQGRITLRRQPVSLATAVERAIEVTQPLIEARRHELRVRFAGDALVVDGDATRLEQVLVNLLSNAGKYTNPGGSIDVLLERAGEDAVVRVRDSGVGISPELLPRVFDLFTQAERSPDRAQGGLGIGLTVAQRIVELHGGKLQAFSEGAGHGAEFVLTLPLLSVAPEDPASRFTIDDGAASHRVRVLIVEDNADAAESLRLLLQLQGHDVCTSPDAGAAIAAATRDRPDLMLVDIGLPGVDGYELARRVRATPQLDEVLLVALTGYGREEDRTTALEAGFDEHLVKPADPARLEALLAMSRSKGRGRRAP